MPQKRGGVVLVNRRRVTVRVLSAVCFAAMMKSSVIVEIALATTLGLLAIISTNRWMTMTVSLDTYAFALQVLHAFSLHFAHS